MGENYPLCRTRTLRMNFVRNNAKTRMRPKMSKHNCPNCQDNGVDSDWTCRKKVCDAPAKSLCPKCEEGYGY